MKIKFLKNSLQIYYRRHYNGSYGLYGLFKNTVGILSFTFAPSIRELKSFIAKFDDNERPFTREEECELLKILITYHLVRDQDFRELIYKLDIFKKNYLSIDRLINIAKLLNSRDLLTADNIEACSSQCRKREFWSYIPMLSVKLLHEANILTQENFNLVMASKDAADCSFIMICLHKIKLLDQKNKISLKNFNGDIYYFHNLIKFFDGSGLLSQDNFDQAIKYNHYLTSNVIHELYEIDDNLLNQDVIQHIYTLCLESNGNINLAVQAIIQYCSPLRRDANQRFNTEQSTHTASVHQSVSASAKNLMNIYGEQITDTKKIMGQLNYGYLLLMKISLKSMQQNALLFGLKTNNCLLIRFQKSIRTNY